MNQSAPDRAEVMETCNRKLRALLRLMLADGSCPAFYRRLVLDWLSKYDRASGLNDDDGITVEECEVVVRQPVVQPVIADPRLLFAHRQRKPIGVCAEVAERIEQVLLALNKNGTMRMVQILSLLGATEIKVLHAVRRSGGAIVKVGPGRYAATRVSELWIDEPGKTPIVHQGSKSA